MPANVLKFVPLAPETFAVTDEASGALRDLVEFFDGHLVLPEGGAVAMGLWCMHSYVVDHLNLSPFLTFSSPVKRSGKSTAIEFVSCAVRNPEICTNPTEAYLTRTIGQNHPTLIIDEFDMLNGNETIRAVLNSGHRRHTAYIGKCVPGDGEHDWRASRFQVFGAKCIGLIGDLPGTLEDRSIVLSMQRRAPGEAIERMAYEKALEHLKPIRESFQRWTDRHGNEFAGHLEPKLSIRGMLDDRQLDNWVPLFAIAEHLGGDCLELAESACLEITFRRDEGSDDPKVLLLRHIREYIETWPEDRIQSSVLVDVLKQNDEGPWRKLTQWTLASMLRPFHVYPVNAKISGKVRKTYSKRSFRGAFERYLR